MNPEEPQQTPATNPVPEQPMQNPGMNQNPAPNIKNPLAVMQPGEQILCEIKRHPIGLIGPYIAATFLVVVAAVLSFVLAPQFFPDVNKDRLFSMGGLVTLFATLIALAYVWITTVVYEGNRWIVTSDSITQVRQTSLFAKQSSQLSLGNLEDISAEQNGIFTHIYNYGAIKAETAGHRSKFVLTYCPNPNYYAQCILDAREKFEQFGGQQGNYENRGGVNVNTES